jgi:hypothetical protein
MTGSVLDILSGIRQMLGGFEGRIAPLTSLRNGKSHPDEQEAIGNFG